MVYKKGVFKPLKECTRALVVIKPARIVEIARQHRIKIKEDVLEEFVEERR